MKKLNLSSSELASEVSRYYSLELRISSSLDPDVSESNYISKIDGIITCQEFTDDDNLDPEPLEVGKLIAYRIFSGRAFAEGADLFEECDAYHQVTLDYYQVLFSKGHEFIPEIEQLFPDTINTDVLILDLIKLLPEHRGRRVGLLAARRLLDMFDGDCGIVACKPFPLQFDYGQHRSLERQASADLAMFKMNKPLAFNKLRKHWSQLGFRCLGNTEYFVLSPIYTVPSLSELVNT